MIFKLTVFKIDIIYSSAPFGRVQISPLFKDEKIAYPAGYIRKYTSNSIVSSSPKNLQRHCAVFQFYNSRLYDRLFHLRVFIDRICQRDTYGNPLLHWFLEHPWYTEYLSDLRVGITQRYLHLGIGICFMFYTFSTSRNMFRCKAPQDKFFASSSIFNR